MIDLTRHTHLIELIFEKPFACMVKPIILDASLPPPKATPDRHFYDVETGVTVEVSNPNEQRILDIMFGHTRFIDTEENNRINAQIPIDVAITINHMAEILAIGGRFTLHDPTDACNISEIVEEYLDSLYSRRNVEPNFIGPPIEDIQKLSKLVNAAMPLATHINRIGRGSGALADLEAMFTRTGIYEIGGENEFFLNQIEATILPNHRQKKINPYSF